MKKKIFVCILICSIIVSTLGISVSAFAENTSWDYDRSTKTLTISGTGDMENFEDEFSSPWFPYIGEIKNFIVDDGVTSVGAYALAGAVHLDSVTLSDTVTSIGKFAFGSCSSLNELYFSNNVKSIADDASFAYDGTVPKGNFTLRCEPAGYPLYYALKNDVPFSCEYVTCGDYTANVVAGDMEVYYPYTAKVSGTFRFSASGTHDTYGKLYDSNHTLLTSDDDGGGGTNFSLTYNLEKGKTYYFSAKIYSTFLTGSFGVRLEGIDYSVSGGFYAMLNPKGECSDILIDEVLIDGKECGGTFSYHITEQMVINYSINGKSFHYVITPDNGDVQNISIQMCNVVNDGIINGKDYVKMYKSGSKYLPLWKNFVNYRIKETT